MRRAFGVETLIRAHQEIARVYNQHRIHGTRRRVVQEDPLRQLVQGGLSTASGAQEEAIPDAMPPRTPAHAQFTSLAQRTPHPSVAPAGSDQLR